MHGNYIAFIYFVWISEQTVMFALSILNRMGLITEVEDVYGAVRTEFLYNTDTFRPYRVNDTSVNPLIAINTFGHYKHVN